MTRYFYWICFSMIGLPLWAGTNYPAGSNSSKVVGKPVTTPAAVPVAQAKARNQRLPIAPAHLLCKSVVSAPAVAKRGPSSSMPQKIASNGQHPGGLSTPALTKSLIIATPTASTALVGVEATPGSVAAHARLARVTAYWAGEGDYYTGRCISATGVRLHDGHCAVDPNIIPYGSVVEIAGVGKYLAVDTGSAVISRTAAREGGHTSAERHALVIDLFFEDRSEGKRFAAAAAKYTSISWWTPDSVGTAARAARSLFAEENWTKIQSKQL